MVRFSALVFVIGLIGTFTSFGQWQLSNKGLLGGDVSCITVDGDNIIVGIDDGAGGWTSGGIYFSDDNGRSWIGKKIFNGTTIDVRTIAVKGKYIFAGTWSGNGDRYPAGRGGVIVSIDSGKNWYEKNLDLGFGNIDIQSIAVKGNNIFAGKFGGGVFLSTDNGNNWSERNIGITNTFVESVATNGDFVCVGTWDDLTGYRRGGVFLSIDNGATWTRKFTDNVHCITIDGNNIYAGTSNGAFLSTDNGTNWKKLGTFNTYVSAIAVSGNNIFIASGTGDGILHSNDNGNSWFAKNIGLTRKYIYCLAIKDGTIFAGTHGGYLFRASINEINDVSETQNSSSPSIYPNPVQGVLNICLENSHITPSSVRVYDVLGRQVAESMIPAGMNEWTIDLSVLPAGIYVVQESTTVQSIVKY